MLSSLQKLINEPDIKELKELEGRTIPVFTCEHCKEFHYMWLYFRQGRSGCLCSKCNNSMGSGVITVREVNPSGNVSKSLESADRMSNPSKIKGKQQFIDGFLKQYHRFKMMLKMEGCSENAAKDALLSSLMHKIGLDDFGLLDVISNLLGKVDEDKLRPHNIFIYNLPKMRFGDERK